MIAHLLKLVWNRKRANALIVVEVFFSFLVLFAVVTLAVYNTRNYIQPLGFSYKDVWVVNIGSLFQLDVLKSADDSPRLMAALKEFPQIESVGGQFLGPFEFGTSNGFYEHKGRRVLAFSNDVTDGFRDVVGIEMVQGRWFDASADALDYDPVVINRRFRDELFGSEDPIGKTISVPTAPRQLRVVGVMTEFRKGGELSAPENFYFRRISMKPGAKIQLMSFLVKVRPGTPPSLQERIVARLRSTSRDRTFSVELLANKRRSFMQFKMIPVLAGGLVAGFMLLMVGLGMVGVVWQSVARRTREIGLRRALGGTARDVYMQVLGELVVIATLGLVLGSLLVAQAPLLGLVSWLTGKLFFVSLGVSLGLMYLLTVAVGLYPSWLATKVQPADVLHYE